MAVLVCIPTNGVRGFPFLCILSSIVCRLFDSSHSDWREMVPHCGFNLHFSDFNRYRNSDGMLLLWPGYWKALAFVLSCSPPSLALLLWRRPALWTDSYRRNWYLQPIPSEDLRLANGYRNELGSDILKSTNSHVSGLGGGSFLSWLKHPKAVKQMQQANPHPGSWCIDTVR